MTITMPAKEMDRILLKGYNTQYNSTLQTALTQTDQVTIELDIHTQCHYIRLDYDKIFHGVSEKITALCILYEFPQIFNLIKRNSLTPCSNLLAIDQEYLLIGEIEESIIIIDAIDPCRYNPIFLEQTYENYGTVVTNISTREQLERLFKSLNNFLKEYNAMTIPMTNDFEFGPVASDKARISPTGIAVTNDGQHWFTYNPATAQTVDVTGFTWDFHNMLYKMPVAVKDLREGDVVMHKGKPMFVIGLDESGINAIDILESEAKIILPVTNMFNFSYVTKIVSFVNLGGSPSPDQPFGNIMPILAAQAIFSDEKDSPFGNDGFGKMMMYNMMMGTGKENSPFGNLFNFGQNN